MKINREEATVTHRGLLTHVEVKMWGVESGEHDAPLITLSVLSGHEDSFAKVFEAALREAAECIQGRLDHLKRGADQPQPQ